MTHRVCGEVEQSLGISCVVGVFLLKEMWKGTAALAMRCSCTVLLHWGSVK